MAMERVGKAKVTGRATYPDDLHNIIGAALFALGHGAKGIWINLPAIQKFRSQFTDKVQSALDEPNWQANWQKEKVYLLAHAEAMGQRAARLAAQDGRAFITTEDIEMAMMKVRGRMPVAGRWCPL
jgi:histone H3/H4